jgi:anti-anti-sigma factor
MAAEDLGLRMAHPRIPPEMPLPHRSFGNARVVMPRGRLDHDNCEAFQSDLAEHLDACSSEAASLVLDLSGLEYVSSAGLRCLMMAARQATAHQSRIMVAAPQPVVAEILQISRFNLVLQVFGTTREALASVSPEAVQAFDRG